MARVFTSGTATDGGGSVPTNGATVQSALRDAILANAAWTLVEEIAGTGTRVVVLKCSAASSGLPSDYFVVIWRDIASGNLSWAMGEAYNSTTHVLTAAPGNTNGTRTIDANGVVNASIPTLTFNAATGNVTAANTPLFSNVTMAATAFWAVIADTDHIVLTVRTFAAYFGAFTSLASGVADPMPLVYLWMPGNTAAPNSASAVLRNPGGTSPVPAGSFNVDDMGQTTPPAFYPGNSGLAFTAGSDRLQGNLPHAYELALVHPRAATYANNIGVLRGKPKRLALAYQGPAGIAVGDTFTMGGTTWLVVGVNANNSAVVCDTGA